MAPRSTENKEVVDEVAVEPTKEVADVPVADVPAPVPQAAPSAAQAMIAKEKGTKVEPNTVTIPVEQWNELFDRLKTLEGSHNLLMQVQDKDKVAKIEEMRRSGKLVKSVKVRRYDGKYIVGWQTMQNEVYVNEEGRIVEKQTIKILFHDGSESEITLRQWASLGEYIPFEVYKESKDEEGNLFFSVRGDDGFELEINATFIN